MGKKIPIIPKQSAFTQTEEEGTQDPIRSLSPAFLPRLGTNLEVNFNLQQSSVGILEIDQANLNFYFQVFN